MDEFQCIWPSAGFKTNIPCSVCKAKRAVRLAWGQTISWSCKAKQAVRLAWGQVISRCCSLMVAAVIGLMTTAAGDRVTKWC